MFIQGHLHERRIESRSSTVWILGGGKSLQNELICSVPSDKRITLSRHIYTYYVAIAATFSSCRVPYTAKFLPGTRQDTRCRELNSCFGPKNFAFDMWSCVGAWSSLTKRTPPPLGLTMALTHLKYNKVKLRIFIFCTLGTNRLLST